MEEAMRLLLVEDEEALATALAQGLRRHGYAVDVAPDGAQGCAAAAVDPYDLLILDLTLPDMDGLAVCRRVRAHRPDLLILMLTARTLPEQRIMGLDEGADDYLTKPFHFGELVARLRALLRRRQSDHAPALTLGQLSLDPAVHVAGVARRRLDLTAKEFALLEYLLRHPTEVSSTDALLAHIWDREADRFSNTVRVHLATLRRKLAAAGAEGYIETVVGVGYRLRPPPDATGEAHGPTD
jgi:DNA-binding response OmpR family regulator